MINSSGPNIEPWGTLQRTGKCEDTLLTYIGNTAFLSEMDQVGLYEVEYLVAYLTSGSVGTKICDLDKCSKNRNRGLGHSRSSKMTPFDRPNASICWCSRVISDRVTAQFVHTKNTILPPLPYLMPRQKFPTTYYMEKLEWWGYQNSNSLTIGLAT